MEEENEKCVVCGSELAKDEDDACYRCKPFMGMKYQSNKLLEEKIKCHKRHAKKLKR